MIILNPEDKEKFVPVYQITRRHIPEDNSLHSHRRVYLEEPSTLKLHGMTFLWNVGI